MKSIGITTVNFAEDILKCNSVVEAHTNFSALRAENLIEKYLSLENYAK